VAGGILPRSALNDGSAEATLLFLEGGEKLAAWSARTGRWDTTRLERARQAMGEARRRYQANFIQDGRLLANQPRRASLVQPPRFGMGSANAAWSSRLVLWRLSGLNAAPPGATCARTAWQKVISLPPFRAVTSSTPSAWFHSISIRL